VWQKAGRPPEMVAGAFSELTETYGAMTVARARRTLGITTEPVQSDDGRVSHHRWLFPPDLEKDPE
jgi:hypothetical protein